jgi:hypothetical protein
MSEERRSQRRKTCRWSGMVTLDSGPRIPVLVADLSPSGAKLTVPAGSGLVERTDLALTAFRRHWWRRHREPAVHAVGRVVRIEPHADGTAEAAVRFHTPAAIH